jgi:hypothetical protein
MPMKCKSATSPGRRFYGRARAPMMRFSVPIDAICGFAFRDPLTAAKSVSRLLLAARERERATKAKVESLSKETRKASSPVGYE